MERGPEPVGGVAQKVLGKGAFSERVQRCIGSGSSYAVDQDAFWGQPELMRGLPVRPRLLGPVLSGQHSLDLGRVKTAAAGEGDEDPEGERDPCAWTVVDPTLEAHSSHRPPSQPSAVESSWKDGPRS